MIKQVLIITRLIPLCFGMLIAAGANAQTWRSFTIDDGLAGREVGHILEDRHGNLWFGTENGASQFSGLFTTH